ncbi:MAG: TonB-dependent receptor, partial [Bacteroidota bacterium]
SYEPFSWLNLTARLGTDLYRDFRRRVTRKGTIGAANGNFITDNLYNRNLNLDVLATITQDISPDINMQLIVGYNVFEQESRFERWVSSDLAADELYSYANANQNAPSNQFLNTPESLQRLLGVFGDLTLSYKDWFFLTLTGRNDWNSTLRNSDLELSEDNISYFFPSVSATWAFTDAFDINGNILSFGKIRANFAEVGSSVGPYNLDFTYLASPDVFTQFQAANNTFPFNGQTAFEVTGTLPEPALIPQRQRSYEVGVELAFFQGRINLDATYYNQLTNNQIVNLSTPPSTGFAARTVNAGSIRNSGWEVTLGLDPVRVPNGFRWNIMANFQRNLQIVEELAEELDDFTLTSGFSGIQIKAEEGEPFGLVGGTWLRDSATNQIIINPETGLRQDGDEGRLGNIYPDFTLGINNQFTFKGLLLSFLVDWRQGGVIYSSTVNSLRNAGLVDETLALRDQTFIDQGVNIDSEGNAVPNVTPVANMSAFWSNYNRTSIAEASIFDATFVKLREIRFGYTFPESMMAKIPIKTLTIAAEGRNVWIMHSRIPHVDPESNFFGTSLTGEGVEFQSVPSVRTVGFNLQIGF